MLRVAAKLASTQTTSHRLLLMAHLLASSLLTVASSLQQCTVNCGVELSGGGVGQSCCDSTKHCVGHTSHQYHWHSCDLKPTLTDLFVAGGSDSSGTNYTCFRIPAAVRLRNRTIVAFAEGRRGSCSDHGDVRMVRRNSDDDGKTWGPIEQVKHETGHTIGNPAPIADFSTGMLHLLYSRDNQQVYYTASADGGATWSDSTNLTATLKPTSDPDAFVGTGPPGGVQLASGRLIFALYYNPPAPAKTTSISAFSDDHGATWQLGGAVPVNPTGHPAVYQGGESQVAVVAGNSLAMLMRVRGDFAAGGPSLGAPRAVNHNHALATSSDGGITWSNASLLPLQTVFCEGSLLGAGDGPLLLSAPSTKNGVRANLTVWSSSRFGDHTDFEYLATIYSGAAAYSSLLASLSPAMYLILFERDNSQAISLTSFEYDFAGREKRLVEAAATATGRAGA